VVVDYRRDAGEIVKRLDGSGNNKMGLRDEDIRSSWLIGFLAGCRCILLRFLERILASAVSILYEM